LIKILLADLFAISFTDLANLLYFRLTNFVIFMIRAHFMLLDDYGTPKICPAAVFLIK